MAGVRDHDRSAHDERHVDRVDELWARVARLHALLEVVVDAVVAAQDGAGDEAEQLLRACVECAVLVGRGVEAEKALES